jgi:hypothetical protein
LRLSRKLGLLVALGAALALPTGSQAAITVGSDLTFTPTGIPNNCGFTSPPCTVIARGVHPGNPFPAKSPTNGVVTSFGIRSSSADTVTFRLVQYENGSVIPGRVRGVGTGPTVTLPSGGTFSFPASLAIHAGDYLGFNTSSTRANQGTPCTTQQYGFLNAVSVLPDSDAYETADGSSTCELLVNAVVKPSSTFKVAKGLKVKLAKVLLNVDVPGPGELTATGKGVKASSAGGPSASVSQRVKQAGEVQLKIKLTRDTSQKLRNKGKATLKVKIKFAPTGGTPSTQKRKLKLKLK